MDSADPFPSSLTNFNTPDIFDPDGTYGGGFFDSAMAPGSPGRFIPEENFLSSPYQSPRPAKAQQSHTVKSEPATSAQQFSASPPDGSLQDSSSDSSGRHKRKSSSSRSSQSVAHGQPPMLGMANEKNGQQYSYGNYKSNSREGAFSDQNMENDFDFTSAASSPNTHLTNRPPAGYTGPRHIAMPYRNSPKVAAGRLPQASGTTQQKGRETSPLVRTMLSTPQSSSRSSPSSGADEFLDETMMDGMEQLTTWPYDGMTMGTQMNVGMATFQQQMAAMNAVVSNAAQQGPQAAQQASYSFTVHPTPSKSRVETQIPIKLTIFPLPPGVSKLHLPTHTISKPKLLAKPTPDRSPEMLELHTMLVCTSAMQDRTKMTRALERARQPSSMEVLEKPNDPGPGEPELAEDDESRPLNGGPVHICDGCITRERKRAARKKSKKPDEEELWQKEEAKRIIVFNTAEVKNWEQPTPMSARMSNGEGYQGIEPFVPNGAMQVDVPMRIACYCRHQNEKMGFQVILTLRDYRDNVLAQTITNPIIITDDHKTHAPSAMNPMANAYQEYPQAMMNGGFYAQDAIDSYCAPTFRTARSTPDLPSLQHGFNPFQMPATTHPFAIPQNVSQTSSSTLTPNNLSHSNSPSQLNGPAPKKRKASGSNRIPRELTMTRLQMTSNNSINPANPAWPSNDTVFPTTSITAPSSPYASNQMFGHAHSQSANMRRTNIHTNPSTPAERNFFSAANRSQSMENFSLVNQMFSAPTSSHQSRAASPVTEHRNGPAFTADQIQAAFSSVYASPTQLSPQRMPTIHKLIPSEGPKAGGIEVTCLGSGFSQGLEVMFGSSIATTTTYWGETSLVCLLPPALHAGMVAVTFKHQYQQIAMGQAPKNQVYFKYNDDDEQEMMRLALMIVGHKATGKRENVGDIARSIISNHHGASLNSWGGGGSYGGGGMTRQVSDMAGQMGEEPGLEPKILKCLDVIDLDDSPFDAPWNMQNRRGQTLLHLGATLGYQQLVAALLARGANADVRDRNGLCPMHLAAMHGFPLIVRRLKAARADPTLRSLRGYTPADMATTPAVRQAVQAIHLRSRSAGNSFSHHSRASSGGSIRSIPSTTSSSSEVPTLSRVSTASQADNHVLVHRSIPTTQVWAPSRRNSTEPSPTNATTALEPVSPTTLIDSGSHAGGLSPAAAMNAWRDQLAAQIQHFQNSVNWAMPNLQMPMLPPMPNLPDYQDHPMVRRISAFVPQMASQRPSASNGGGAVAGVSDTVGNENKERWWDLLGGRNASMPPPYEEIFPAAGSRNESDDASLLKKAAEALLDRQTTENFARSLQIGSAGKPSIATGSVVRSGSMTADSLARHRRQSADLEDALREKQLRSDRRLFLIWVSLV
ncbi:hypothetical protein MMC25_000749 [Agyrium rufum]|nr:hypothetical protein [Agyrium rufum]